MRFYHLKMGKLTDFTTILFVKSIKTSDFNY